MATRFTSRLQVKVIRGCRKQQRVNAIERAAMARNQGRAVLDARDPLEARLEQIAGDAERDDGEAEYEERQRARQRKHEAACERDEQARGDESANGAFDRLLGTDRG